MNDKERAFIDMLEQHKGILFRIANSYSKHAEDRQDLIQEMLVQLWLSFDRYKAEYSAKSTWIYRIALNVAISSLRRATSKNRIQLTLKATMPDIFDSSSADSTKEPFLQALETCIASLPDLDRALLLLYLEDKSHQEIADIMGISVSNVGTKISRIKRYVKEKLTSIQIT